MDRSSQKSWGQLNNDWVKKALHLHRRFFPADPVSGKDGAARRLAALERKLSAIMYSPTGENGSQAVRFLLRR